MLIKLNDSEYELAKFATKFGYENIGAGKKVLDYALNDAKRFAKRIIIATNIEVSSLTYSFWKKYDDMVTAYLKSITLDNLVEESRTRDYMDFSI